MPVRRARTQPLERHSRLGSTGGSSTGLRHAERGQHAAYADHARRDGVVVEAEVLTGLVEQHLRPVLAGGVAQRPVTDPRVEHHRRTEGGGQLARTGVVEVGAHLREVAAAVGAGVQVDAHLAAGDDLAHEEVGDPAGERPARRAGEGAVEVAAVGEVRGRRS